jgi:DNA invertase Pin-like site-specific DNA recombinase
VVGQFVGYARVSGLAQKQAAQVTALTAAGCHQIYIDYVSGTDRLLRFEEMRERLAPGDTVVVVRLDRLGRSLAEVLANAGRLSERGLHLRSLTEQIDTGRPGGNGAYRIFATLLAAHRELQREQTTLGIAAARASARTSTAGRRLTMTPDRVALARQLYASGEYRVQEIADAIGVTRQTIHRVIREAERAEPADPEPE